MTAKKRALAVAMPAGASRRLRIGPVDAVDTLLARLRDEAGDRPILFGVDAPIGLPLAYAQRHAAGHRDFPSFLAGLADDDAFFQVCDRIDQVSGARPFFPRTTSGAPRRQEQGTRLGVAHPDALLRHCDRKTAARPRAACLFWTLGANQVGKAALTLWREVLRPGLAGAEPVALWPFDGDLETLLRTRRVVVAETYPAEALRRLHPTWRGSKRRQTDRASVAATLRAAIGRLQAVPDPALGAAIENGFGAESEAEDQFDSLVGLLGMLMTLQSTQDETAPKDDATRRWEGWIFGQRP